MSRARWRDFRTVWKRFNGAGCQSRGHAGVSWPGWPRGEEKEAAKGPKPSLPRSHPLLLPTLCSLNKRKVFLYYLHDARSLKGVWRAEWELKTLVAESQSQNKGWYLQRKPFSPHSLYRHKGNIEESFTDQGDDLKIGCTGDLWQLMDSYSFLWRLRKGEGALWKISRFPGFCRWKKRLLSEHLTDFLPGFPFCDWKKHFFF